MKWTQRLVNRIRLSPRDRPKPGRILSPRREDSLRDYPSSGLTPSGLITLLREADEGSLATAMHLYEEMEEKDAHLFSVANTRRLALTGLPWQVVSAADEHPVADRALADEAASFCREILSCLDSFDEMLQHLSLALGRNISIAEIVWDDDEDVLKPMELVPVDFTRIIFDSLDRPRILTQDQPREGIEPTPHKFIVHTPHNVSGHPQRGGLLRVSAMIYLAKNLALKDWMIFAELFGMPVRIARYDSTATDEEKRQLLNMLESLGSNAAGIFSRGVELQFVESGQGTTGPPYELLVNFLNREMSKAWLGQTLTTDISGLSGSVAAAKTQENVRQDLLTDDIRKEGRTLRRDLLTPMTQFRFGPDAPVPYFRRKRQATHDPRELADVLDAATRKLGMRVSAGWAHDALGIPRATENEVLLSPAG